MPKSLKIGAALAVLILCAPWRVAEAAAGPDVEAAAQTVSRPKIGLVLGGGGALGLAHVGVLKVLEEQRIPIDCVAGTSMGSIIGGLYACGMSPDEIQTFLEGIDWNEVMRDETPRRELFFRRKAEDQRYLFEIGVGRRGFKMGTGMAAGQKFNNLMEFITLRAASVKHFDNLPIPYRAVATDLLSGMPYVIDHGNLATAMRASMAVPGVFTTVELDGRILVDGGIVDNLPVEVARAMGADIIIAVDVGSRSDKVHPEKLKSVAGILGRTYAVARRPDQLEMFERADVGIQPALDDFTASQFARAAELIPQGEASARAKIEELSRYRVGAEDYAAFLARQRRANPESIPIGAVTVSGNQRVSEAVIRGRIRSRPGTPFDRRQVDLDLMRVYGLGEFEQVLAKLTPVGETASDLSFDVTEKSSGPLYFKYGLHLQSNLEKDAEWGMLLNLSLMSVNALGAEWKNEIEVGSVQDAVSEFYQPLDSSGLFFVAPTVRYHSELEAVYQEDRRIAEYDVTRYEGGLDLGLQLRDYAELRAGPFWGKGRARVETGAADLPEVDEKLAGWRVVLTVDRQDRTIFARQGSYFKAEGQFARESLGGDRDFDKVYAVYREQRSLGDHTILFGLRYGSSLNSDLPGYAQFKLGGPFGFAGLNQGQFRGSALGVASVGYRYRLVELPSSLGRGVYALTHVDAGNVWPSEDDMDISDSRVGVAFGLGADTALGPMYLGYGIAEDGFDSWYFSLGTAF